MNGAFPWPGPGEVVAVVAYYQTWHGRDSSLVTGLSQVERARAARFRDERLRSRFVVAHGLLRQVLGSWLGVAPADVAFASGPGGKPALDPEGPLRFNLSHDVDRVGIALAHGREVGIDLARLTEVPSVEALAAQTTAQERALLARATPADRARLCHRLWTRKEAVVKACGFGLAVQLSRVDVAPGHDGPVVVAGLPPPAEPTRTYGVVDLPPLDGAAGAVALEGGGVPSVRVVTLEP